MSDPDMREDDAEDVQHLGYQFLIDRVVLGDEDIRANPGAGQVFHAGVVVAAAKVANRKPKGANLRRYSVRISVLHARLITVESIG